RSTVASVDCYHLSKLDQVPMILQNFFLNAKEDLYLLQIDPKKEVNKMEYEIKARNFLRLPSHPVSVLYDLGDGLTYEAVDDVNSFPHFYGPDKTYIYI
ncbi:hypothetical protein EUTSA_v10009552mg, partial [Eutrema salsugineum]